MGGRMKTTWDNEKVSITIIGLFIYLMICFSFVELNTDSCTQGATDFYNFTAIKLIFLSSILICYEIHFSKLINEKIVIFNILKFIGICITTIQSMPYIIFTTIKGISICQGSTEWGGFSNKYKFESLPMAENIIERLLPVCYITVALVFVILLFIENKNLLKKYKANIILLLSRF